MSDDADTEVHPELALELVQKHRKRGGFWRLLQTGFVVTTPMLVLLGLAIGSPMLALVGAAGTALLVRNLVQNARSFRAAELLHAAAELPKPLLAETRGRMLRVGSASLPRERWHEIQITEHERRELRHLALPAARVHRDDGRA